MPALEDGGDETVKTTILASRPPASTVVRAQRTRMEDFPVFVRKDTKENIVEKQRLKPSQKFAGAPPSRVRMAVLVLKITAHSLVGVVLDLQDQYAKRAYACQTRVRTLEHVCHITA